MASDQDLARIRQGGNTWNDWRTENRESPVDLSGANLAKTDLREADLSRANLQNADLREADLSGANLQEANLREANLTYAKSYRSEAIEGGSH